MLLRIELIRRILCIFSYTRYYTLEYINTDASVQFLFDNRNYNNNENKN